GFEAKLGGGGRPSRAPLANWSAHRGSVYALGASLIAVQHRLPPLLQALCLKAHDGVLFSMGKIKRAKLLIIGSGAAGYTAAIYAARAMLEPILIQGIQPGGQLTITTDVENYPGFADVIQGPWLMEQMQKQAEHVGTKLISDHVSKVDLGHRPFQLECE